MDYQAMLMALVDKALEGRDVPNTRRAFADIAEAIRDKAYQDGYRAALRAAREAGVMT